MSPRPVVTLISSDDEGTRLLPALAKLSQSPKDIRPAQSGFLNLSDDFDGNIYIDNSWPTPSPKRRKVSLSPLQEHPTNGTIIATAIPQPANPSKAREVGLKISKPYEWPQNSLNPLLLSSSTKETAPTSGIPLNEKLLSLSDGSDNEMLMGGPLCMVQHPQESRPDLSERTAALLASLAASTDSSTRDRAPLRVLQNPGSKRPRNTKPRDDLQINSDRVASVCHDGGSFRPQQVTKRRGLTDAEKEARVREIERAKGEAKERKRLEKEEKAHEKQLAADLAEANKARTDKKISTPEMIVDLPASIEGQSVGNQVKVLLKDLGVQATTYESESPNVIKFRRKTTRRFDQDTNQWEMISEEVLKEKHVMCLVSAKEFVDLVLGNIAQAYDQGLDAHVLKVKGCIEGCAPIYLIEGLAVWMRKNKTIRNRAYQAAVLGQIDSHGGVPSNSAEQPKSRRKKPAEEYIDEDTIEDALLRLQVVHGCLVHHTTTAIDTATWIANFTQHISTIPYRLQKTYLDTSFCMDVGQVKTGDDKEDTYIKMLQTILQITVPAAYGIAAQYPSVLSLVRGFRKHGPTALEDLKKSANRNGAVTDRKIGRALGRKVYNVFMGQDPSSTDV